ncbi:MAG: rubredoxin [Promethearchaeota archaeon]
MGKVPLLNEIYYCKICGFGFSEKDSGVKWENVPDDYKCPICGASKDQFYKRE